MKWPRIVERNMPEKSKDIDVDDYLLVAELVWALDYALSRVRAGDKYNVFENTHIYNELREYRDIPWVHNAIRRRALERYFNEQKRGH